jgi:hypothetical protein
VQRPRKNDRTVIVLLLSATSFVASLLIVVPVAHAFEVGAQEGEVAPCAVVENFQGDLEILDPTRTHIINVGKNVGIPCGGWVSSEMGWALIRHRDGHDLRVGPNTFIEIPENNANSPDQVVLYHGEVYGSTEGGGGDLRVTTANARVRVPKGAVLVNYDAENQDTQLVALDHPATLENRFEPDQKIKIQAGESTSLNFKQLRVVPTFPKAVSIASLKEKLVLFRLNEKDAADAYQVAEVRAERRLAATLTPEQEMAKQDALDKQQAKDDLKDGPKDGVKDDLEFKPKETPVVAPGRKLASEGGVKNATYSYERGPVTTDDEGQMLKSHWLRKMTAGEDLGERMLFPEKNHGKARKVSVVVDDPGAQMDAKKQKVEDAEKRKLIEELSQIHED